MKAILDISKEQEDPPPLLNAEVLSQLYTFIVQNPQKQIKFAELYKQLCINSLEGNKEIIKDERGGKWIKIPSKKNSPKDFKKNVKDLVNISQGSGWCVAGEDFASNYLSQGDFWIYYHQLKDKQKAKIAIRMVGDNIKEIRGDQAGQAIEIGYETVADEFINQKQLQGGEEYRQKLEEQKLAKEQLNNIIEKLRIGQKLNEQEFTLITPPLSTNILPLLYVYKKLNYDASKIPPESLNTFIFDARISSKFAEGVNFDVHKIPKEIITGISEDAYYSLDFVRKNGFVTTDIPKEIINAISKNIGTSLIFAEGMGFDVQKIPKEMIKIISTGETTSFDFAQGTNFNLNELPKH
ncbi:MAG: hypothetical protein WC375_00385 [Methanomassiliicoccales archaeon]|jgi:hypothetical protein